MIASLPRRCCSWCYTSPEVKTFGILTAHLKLRWVRSASEVEWKSGFADHFYKRPRWFYLSQLGGDPVKLSQQRHWSNLVMSVIISNTTIIIKIIINIIMNKQRQPGHIHYSYDNTFYERHHHAIMQSCSHLMSIQASNFRNAKKNQRC